MRKNLPKGVALVPLRNVREGTVLICDDGFTCIDAGAVRKVFRDRSKNYGSRWDFDRGRWHYEPKNSRSRLYARCDHRRHYLDGQECGAGAHGMKGPHYVGFWVKKPRRAWSGSR